MFRSTAARATAKTDVFGSKKALESNALVLALLN
jgi:hypothetical protein